MVVSEHKTCYDMSIEIVSNKFGKGKQQHSDGVVGEGGVQTRQGYGLGIEIWVLYVFHDAGLSSRRYCVD